MAASERRPAAAGVRRGHRGRAGAARTTTSPRFKEILDRHGLTAGWYGHASVGCLHIRPFVDLTEPGGIETMSAVAEEVVDAGAPSSTA